MVSSLMPSPSRLAALALEIRLAEAEVGVYEDPPRSNRGPRVDDYQTGRASLGQAWCLKFVNWCYAQAAIRLSVPNPLPPIYLVSAFLGWARKEKKVVTDPMKGDILVKKAAQHAGLVLTELAGGDVFSSVEGNTWKSDPEKEGVYVVQRLHAVKYEFVRVAT
jgi:hypothetical protein